ncbi:MAG: PD-(D/E)XK nuclease family protein, partial [Clostridia bacterium]|nr:PD-(D/E)XK nuclease family protein [Clostridia bacterium]
MAFLFVLCHFSYFCTHILKLDEKKPAKFDASDIGNFIHRILEIFISRAEAMGG